MHLSATGKLGERPICNTRRSVMTTNLVGSTDGCLAFQDVPIKQRCVKCNARYNSYMSKQQAQ